MTPYKPHILILLTLISLFTFRHLAQAETDEWRVQLSPYFWVSGADIDEATINGSSASADLDFSDIWDLLDFGGFLRLEAWKGKWGIIIDTMYFDLGAEGEITPRLGPVIFPTVEADMDFKQLGVDLGISRRFDLSPGQRSESLWIDPVVGIRYVYLKQEVDVSKAAGAFIGAVGRTLGGDEDWVEPFLGLRIGVTLTDTLTFLIRGDVGGFGVGSASDLTWNLLAGFDFKPWQDISIKAGYRIYDIDYEKGSGRDEFGSDSQLTGPALGITFHF